MQTHTQTCMGTLMCTCAHTHIHTCVEMCILLMLHHAVFPPSFRVLLSLPYSFLGSQEQQAWLMDTWWERTKQPLSSRHLLGTNKSLMEILRYQSHAMINQTLGSTKQPAVVAIPNPCLGFFQLCNPDLLEALWRQSGHYPPIWHMLWLFPSAQVVWSLLIHWDSSKGLVQSCGSPSRTVECAIAVFEQYSAKPRSLHGEVMLLSKSWW